jgi:hypothetical protein
MHPMLMQVTFQFPTDTDIRYLEQPPRRGDRVRGRRGERFVVAHVNREGDVYLARCVTSVDFASDRPTALAKAEHDRARDARANPRGRALVARAASTHAASEE